MPHEPRDFERWSARLDAQARVGIPNAWNFKLY
jgi:hypothetical protein